jgi:hypothetical protein
LISSEYISAGLPQLGTRTDVEASKTRRDLMSKVGLIDTRGAGWAHALTLFAELACANLGQDKEFRWRQTRTCPWRNWAAARRLETRSKSRSKHWGACRLAPRYHDLCQDNVVALVERLLVGCQHT